MTDFQYVNASMDVNKLKNRSMKHLPRKLKSLDNMLVIILDLQLTAHEYAWLVMKLNLTTFVLITLM